MDKKQKVLIANSDSSYTSGAFRCMLEMCELLKMSNEYEPIVVLPKKGNGQSLLEKAGIRYKVIRSYGWTVKICERRNPRVLLEILIKLMLNTITVLRIALFIRNAEVDLVHINTIGTYVAAAAAIIDKKPIIWHVREALDLDHNKSLISGKCYDLINRANAIICVSEHVYSHYSDRLDMNKMKVVYDGVDKNVYYYDRSISSSDRCVEFLCIGNMNSNKGQEDIIAAGKILRSYDKPFHISFVGSGRKKDSLVEMARELEGFITFHEIADDVTEYYRNADVFIMSSKAEAFGRTTVEAMMSGCLVIGAKAGATPEIIENGITGLLYEYGDSRELADLMMGVIDNRLRYKEIINAGQDKAIKLFSTNKSMEKIQKVYETVLINKR